MNARVVVIVLLLGGLLPASCSEGLSAAAPISSLSEAELAALRLDVIEAAVEHLALPYSRKFEHVFLAVDGAAPSPACLARFADHQPRMHSVADAVLEPLVRHHDQDGPAIVYRVEQLDVKSVRQAELRAGFWTGLMFSVEYRYALERGLDGQWAVVSEQLTSTP